MKVLDIFKLDLKEKIITLKQLDTYGYIMFGIMFVIGIPFPRLNFLFYLSFVYLSYKLNENKLTKSGMFYHLLPFFLLVGIWIWNEVFPYILGFIPIGVVLSVLLCALVSNLGYLFLTQIKIKTGNIILLPSFFFLLDFVFQEIPYIRYIEMPIILGSIYNHTYIIRLASIFGSHVALFIIIVVINTLTIMVTERRYNLKNISVIICGILFIIISNHTVDSSISTDSDGVKVSALQPNITFDGLKYRTYENKIELTFNKYRESIKNEEANIFVFPEDVVGLLDREKMKWQDTIERIVKLSKEKDAYITALVIEGNSITKVKDERFITTLLVSPEGVIGKSSKRNLVPFGESNRYSKGNSYDVFNTEHGNIGISICYDINSNTIEKLKGNGAQIILAPFNDKGFSVIYHNIHSYYPVIRAVENNIPIVVANEDGISQIVDSNGKIIKRLGMGERGVISARFNLRHMKSFYLYFGKYIEVMIFLALLLIIFVNVLRGHNFFKERNCRDTTLKS